MKSTNMQLDKARAYVTIELTTSVETRHYLKRLIGFGWSNDQILSYINDLFVKDEDRQVFCAAIDYMREQMSLTN